MGLGQQANVDPVLSKELIQFQLPAAETAYQQVNRMSSVCLVRLDRASLLSYKEDDFEDIPEQVGPEGRVETNVRILRINSIHSLRGGCLEDCISRWASGWVGTISSLGLDYEGFARVEVFFGCHWDLPRVYRDFRR